VKKAAFFYRDAADIDRVYAKGGRRERIAQITDLFPQIITQDNFDKYVDDLQGLEVIFSSWGWPRLSEEKFEQLPNLRAVFYAAGSVKGLAGPFLARGITVVSAWGANAVPVAEFALSQILLSCKGYFRNIRDCGSAPSRRVATPFRGKGNFGETVAVVGAGMVGRRLIELLGHFELKVVVCDPYLDEDAAEQLSVRKVSLEEAFEQAYVISNHVPDLPETRGMIDKRLFLKMRDYATFINTGRGKTVVERDLVKVFRERPTLTALLDVTDPEPPDEDSPVYSMPNVYLTSHIAGSIGDEVCRLADYCIEEFLAWEKGEPLRHAVTPEMLKTMA